MCQRLPRFVGNIFTLHLLHGLPLLRLLVSPGVISVSALLRLVSALAICLVLLHFSSFIIGNAALLSVWLKLFMFPYLIYLFLTLPSYCFCALVDLFSTYMVGFSVPLS